MDDGPDFDLVAGAYAAYRTGFAEATVETIVSEAGPGASVLDVATGTGLLADQLRPCVGRVVGADIAVRMLRAALPPVVQAPAEQLPFRVAAFDAVTCAEAFHWLDRARAAAEFRRVVRPGGAILVLWKAASRTEPYEPLADRVLEDIVGAAPRRTGGDVAALGEIGRAHV